MRKPGSVDTSQFRAAPFDRIDEVAIITTHFNPMRFNRLRDTYYEWFPSLGPLAEKQVCVELLFDDDEPEINGSHVIRGTRERNGMWQKEAMTNIAIRQLPKEIRYVAWLDHDIIIADPHWLAKSIAMIDDGSVAVQLFETLQMLDAEKVPTCRKTAAAKTGKGAPGGAWIADRRYLDAVGGLDPNHIVGAGDQAMFCAMSGIEPEYLKTDIDDYGDYARSWIAVATSEAQGRWCRHLPTNAVHLYHGDSVNRQYQSRRDIITRHNFRPGVDAVIGDHGLLEWATDKPELHADVAKYFADRREDG